MVTLTQVSSDELYSKVHEYVESNKIIIEDYDGMVKAVLRMIKDGYCFTMDRDLLRDAMESLTYMYAPDDDMNKDRLMQQLVDDSDDSDDEGGVEEEEEGDFGNMDMLRMMQMMSGQPIGSPDNEVVVTKEEEGAELKAEECAQDECAQDECAQVEEVVPETTAEEELVPSEKVD